MEGKFIKKILVLHNEISGKKNKKVLIEKITNSLNLKNQVTTIIFDDIKGIIQNPKLNDKYDLLIISGGDSSVSYVINQFPTLEIPILIIPTGSGNDFAKYFNMTQNIKKIVNAVERFEIYPVVNIKVNNKIRIINFASFGFESRVTYLANKLPRFMGKFKYTLATLICLTGRNYESLKFESPIFSEIGQYSLAIVVANSFNFGKRINNQFMDQGSNLYLILIERTNKIKFLYLYVLFQFNQHSNRKEFRIIPLKELQIDSTHEILKSCADSVALTQGPVKIHMETNVVHLLKI